MARIKTSIRKGAVIQVVGPMIDAAGYRAAQKMRGRVMANIHSSGRIDTGKMVQGMQVRTIARSGTAVAYQIYSTAFYTVFQELGTKAHGPKVAQAMVFTPKGGSGVVFAKWVRGVTPAYFMRNAYRDAKIADAAK